MTLEGKKLIAVPEYAELLHLSVETVRRGLRRKQIVGEAIYGSPHNGYVIDVEAEAQRLEAIGAKTYAQKLRDGAALLPDRPIEAFMNRRGRGRGV